MATKKIKIPSSKMLNQTLALVTKTAGKKVMAHFEKNFDNQGAENEKGTFKRWKERSASNKSRKPILKDTGKMRKSFKLKTKKDQFSIKIMVPYARFHQTGTDILPEREMLYHSEKIDDIIVKELDDVILKMLG